jgi:hypothetical protein
MQNILGHVKGHTLPSNKEYIEKKSFIVFLEPIYAAGPTIMSTTLLKTKMNVILYFAV